MCGLVLSVVCCCVFSGCVRASNDHVFTGSVYLSWATGMACTTAKGPYSGFDGKLIHCAIGGVYPLRTEGRAGVFRRREGHLPTPQHLGSPYVGLNVKSQYANLVFH